MLFSSASEYVYVNVVVGFFPQLTLRKKPFSFFYKVVNLFLASLRYNRPFANKV